jgi:hypothetical protein
MSPWCQWRTRLLLLVTSLRRHKFTDTRWSVTVGTVQWAVFLGTDQNIVLLSAAGRVILHKWHQNRFVSVSISFTCSLRQIVNLLASQKDLYVMGLFVCLFGCTSVSQPVSQSGSQDYFVGHYGPIISSCLLLLLMCMHVSVQQALLQCYQQNTAWFSRVWICDHVAHYWKIGSPALEIPLAVRNSLHVWCQQIFRIFAPYSGYFGRAWTPVYSFPSCNKLADFHSLQFYFFSVNFNIILPPNPGLSRLSLYDRNY